MAWHSLSALHQQLRLVHFYQHRRSILVLLLKFLVSLSGTEVAISQNESPVGAEIHKSHRQIVHVSQVARERKSLTVPSGAINPLARSCKGLQNASLMKDGKPQLFNLHSCYPQV